MKFIEPMRGHEIEFKMVEMSKLVPGEFQRDISTGLVNKLTYSTDYGFIIPIVVVRTEDGLYEVIDGQHRLETVKNRVGDVEVPCVVVPREFKYRPLLLNIEKADNIKDKCTKVHNVYMYYFNVHPEIEEKELLPATGFVPSIFTLAFAYREFTLASPSLVETVVKKFDGVIDAEVSIAIEERRQRAMKVCELENLVSEVADEYGFKDFNLKKAVISKSSMALWGRTRTLGIDFESGINDLIMQIEQTDWSMFGG